MTLSIPGAAKNLTLTVGGESLDVREFSVDEGVSRLFDARIVAMSASADVDFEAAIGGPARFEINHGAADGQSRVFAGVCASIEQLAVEVDGLSTYQVRVAPTLWLLTQRRNYKVFQDKSELDIVQEILAGWGIRPELRLDAASFPKRRYRVQYAESDFDFVSRMLEDIGVSYFVDTAGSGDALVLADAPNRGAVRGNIPFVGQPNVHLAHDHVTAVRSERRLRPGRYTQSDVDWRKPLDYPLAASSTLGGSVESALERYHHNYGAFLWKGPASGDTPVADDRGAARTSEADGAKQVQKRMEAQRSDARVISFRTNAWDLRPGQVLVIGDHPRSDLGGPVLVVGAELRGTATGEWSLTCDARPADADYRPRLSTPKPRTHGIEAATITGPAGEEIHTDELGRVRVHFHWDREGASDQTSSCWVPVSQPWAGAGMGAISLPRVGQEVIVDFLGGDPDRPIVVGSVFTTTQPPPYELPAFKMVSGMRSETYPRPKPGGAARMGGGGAGGAAMPMGGGGSSRRSGKKAPAPAAPAPAPEPPGFEPLPGLFSPGQATPAELVQSTTGNQALGPDERDVTRYSNAIVSNDTFNGEQLYLQGERDLHMVSKRNTTGSVGGNRVITVHMNDSESVVGHQNTTVNMMRTVKVGQAQAHIVQGDITCHGQANHIIVTKNHFVCQTETGGQTLQAKTGIMLKVGDEGGSSLIMLPNCIIIDAPETLINPGKDVIASILGGATPKDAVAANARKDRVNAAAKALLKPTYSHARSALRAGIAANEKGVREQARSSGGLQNDGEINDALSQADQQAKADGMSDGAMRQNHPHLAKHFPDD